MGRQAAKKDLSAPNFSVLGAMVPEKNAADDVQIGSVEWPLQQKLAGGNRDAGSLSLEEQQGAGPSARLGCGRRETLGRLANPLSIFAIASVAEAVSRFAACPIHGWCRFPA